MPPPASMATPFQSSVSIKKTLLAVVSLAPFYSHLLMQDHTAVPLFIWRSGITQGGPEDGGVRLAGGAPCPSAEAIEINDQNAVASVPLGRTDPSKDPQETNKLHRK